MLTEKVVTTFTIACDGAALGALCPTRPIETPTEAGLIGILGHWRLSVHDGKIDRDTPIYCPSCVKALEAARKLSA